MILSYKNQHQINLGLPMKKPESRAKASEMYKNQGKKSKNKCKKQSKKHFLTSKTNINN